MNCFLWRSELKVEDLLKKELEIDGADIHDRMKWRLNVINQKNGL